VRSLPSFGRSARLWYPRLRRPGKRSPPLEKRVGDLTQESEEQKAAAEGYKGEVARLEALLAEKDLALNQTQADLTAALSQVARWHQSSAEQEKRAEGKICIFYLGPLCSFG